MTSLRNIAIDTVRNMPRRFWLLAMIFTVTASILLLDHFRTYTSEVAILVVHKNEKTAASADQVVDNITKLPETLAFYNLLLTRFPEVNDPWIGMGDDERKRLWSDRISVDRVDYSGMIRMTVNADTSADAALLVQKSALNLFQIIGQYYAIGTELDIRTVDAPVTRTEVSHPIAWLLTSLIVGFVSAFVISSALAVFSARSNSLPVLIDAKRKRNDVVPSFKDEVIAQRPQKNMLPLQPVMFEKALSLNDTPAAKTPEAEPKAEIASPTEPEELVIPALPFLEDGVSLEEHLFGMMPAMNDTIAHEVSEDAVAPIVEEPAKPTIMAEPTPEELKRRLNQLLNGDM